MPEVKEGSVGDPVFRANGDVVFIRPVGVLSLEQAQLVTSIADEVVARHGHTFLLADLQHAGLVPVETRRLLAKYGAEKPPLAIALYHVSPLIRGVNALLFGAMNLLSKQRQNMMQFSTEAAAKSWLEAERERLMPKTPSS